MNHIGQLAALGLSLAVAGSASAVGVRKINQACAVNTGCFPGDAKLFPVRISAPGSYRLTSNLTVPNANTSAILLATSHVTIDLNGFRISGPTTCTTFGQNSCSPTGTGNGIDISGFPSAITVKNGVISGMGAFGVGLSLGLGHRIEGLTVRDTGFQGIRISGGTVKDCAVFATGANGISTNTAVVTGNFVDLAGDHGIFMDSGLAEGNSVGRSDGDGINTDDSIVTTNLLVRDNAVQTNTGFGLALRAEVGYVGNLIAGNNGGTVSGGIQMGTNLCNGSTTCP